MSKKSHEDELSNVYMLVRDATWCNDIISTAEKIAVLETVKYEILRAAQESIERE